MKKTIERLAGLIFIAYVAVIISIIGGVVWLIYYLVTSPTVRGWLGY